MKIKSLCIGLMWLIFVIIIQMTGVVLSERLKINQKANTSAPSHVLSNIHKAVPILLT